MYGNAMDVKVTKNKLGGYARGLKPRIAAAVQATASDIETYAKVLAPVSTGALRDSITAQSDGDLSAVVGSDLDYAVYQEYGTSRMPAQPFLTPATDQGAVDFADYLKKALRFE